MFSKLISDLLLPYFPFLVKYPRYPQQRKETLKTGSSLVGRLWSNNLTG